MGLKIGQTKVFAAKRIDIKMKQKSGYKSVKDIIDAIKRKETSIDTTLKIPSSDETYTWELPKAIRKLGIKDIRYGTLNPTGEGYTLYL